MKQIRVLVVDDHYFVRKGIAMFLKTDPDIAVVEEAINGLEAVKLAQQTQPDVVLMDLSMPDGDGIDAISEMKKANPETKIIVHTMHADKVRVDAAMKAGADGYLLKDADEKALLKAILDVQQGETPLHPQVVRHLVDGLVQPITSPTLTEREEQVLGLLAQGMSNKDIADSLHLSPGTIKIYVSRILAKLGVTSRTEAAVKALQLGLTNIEEGS